MYTVEKDVSFMWCRKPVCLSALSLLLLAAQLPGQAQSSPPDALPFFKNYFVTGDYSVGSIDLTNPAGGFATGDIHFNDAIGNTVPANADILAAFLVLGNDHAAAGPSESCRRAVSR